MNVKQTVNAVALLAALSLTGCDQREVAVGSEPSRTTGNPGGTTQTMESNKDQTVTNMKKALNEMDAKIDQLAKNISTNYTAQAKSEADETLAKLRALRHATNQKLEDVQSASKETWQDAKPEMERAWRNLQNAYNNAREKLTE